MVQSKSEFFSKGVENQSRPDIVIDLKRKDVWEDNTHWSQSTSGKHPNNTGYELIAEELYKFILNLNLIENHINKSKNYLI
jgi:lysophospholipase L1-like esterase